MRRYPALAAVRVGCVQYLNSKPLIHGCDLPVIFDHPAGLARDLARGALDVALVPVFEALRSPGWLAVDDVAIACDGPVFSVFLAHRGPLSDVRTIALDPASLTSVHLLQVLLAEYHRAHPVCVPLGSDADALLLIGNQAIDFRTGDRGAHQFLDLGEEWRRCTGLPFVFALWLMRGGLENAAAIADELRAIQRDGLAHLPEIVRADTTHDPAFSMRYLTEHIRFHCGEREKAGIAKFRELLTKHRFIGTDGEPLLFV
ncbi:MAG: chorismate dehydratase [Chthoniobacter sp.]|nr:chorismate dehydratase [Chthoniobacter sp.]